MVMANESSVMGKILDNEDAFLYRLNADPGVDGISNFTSDEVLQQYVNEIQVYTIGVRVRNKGFNIQVVQMSNAFLILESGIPHDPDLMHDTYFRAISSSLLHEVYYSVLDTAMHTLPNFTIYVGEYFPNVENGFDAMSLPNIGSEVITADFGGYFKPSGSIAQQLPSKDYHFGSFRGKTE
jgi:hypothetical protein